MSPCDHAAMTSAPCGWCSSCSEPFDRRTFCPDCHVEARAEDEACANPVCRQPRSPSGWTQLPRELGGGFTLLMGMGRGHWGAVYVARKGRQEVAARICYTAGRRADAARLFSERCNRERSYQRFLKDYDDIVHSLDVGQSAGGVPYLIMELVRGNTLERTMGRPSGGGDMINRTRPASMDPVRAVRLMRRMCVALGHLHHHKLVHGQLKPSNVFVVNTPQGEGVKLGDMGLAWLQAGGGRGKIKLGPDQVSPASAPYLSPEQVRGETRLTAAADIYSLGVITYEMLTGRLPHVVDEPVHATPDRQQGVDLSSRRWGRFASAWLKAHLNAEPTPLGGVRPDLPASLAGLLEDCLVRDPGERLGDTDAVIMQLAMLEQELGRRPTSGAVAPVKPVKPTPERLMHPTGPLPSPASLGKGAPMAPMAPVMKPAKPASVDAGVFGSPNGGPGVMELAMERDKLTLEVARLKREVGHLTAENQQLRQRLEAVQTGSTKEQAAPPAKAPPAAAPPAAPMDVAKTQERAPVVDEEEGRDRVTRILSPDDVPAELKEPPPSPVKRPRAQKVPFGADLDDLATNIAPARLLDRLVDKASNMEDFVTQDTASGSQLRPNPLEHPEDLRETVPLLEDQPTNILESEELDGDDLEIKAEMTNVIPHDEIFVDVDGPNPVLAGEDATTEHTLQPMATTLDGARFDDED